MARRQTPESTDKDQPPRASPLELAAGWVYGQGAARGTATAEPPEDPLAALRAAIEPALRRPPCVVAFSGGRDSSLVLAVATDLARRLGLPLPVPSTLRYPELPWTDESAWQERVVRHLRLDDWVRINLTNELDCVGEIAQAEIERQGPLFPPNAHSVVPNVAGVGGGTVLMGLGGDELFISHRWRELNDMLGHRRRPNRRDVKLLAQAVLPRRARGRLFARREGRARDLHWLRPSARAALARIEARVPDDPVRFDRTTLLSAQTRALDVGVDTIRRIAAAHAVTLEAPLLEPRFVNALALAGGKRGFGARTATMRAVGSTLLPDDVLARPDKVYFWDVFFTQTTRDFAERWSGEGLDGQLVDPDVLREMWLRPRPDFRSGTLLQAAWLHDHGAAQREAQLASAV